MTDNNSRRRTIPKNYDFDLVSTWISNYLSDCSLRGLSPKTIRFYSEKLAKFQQYCDSKNIANIQDVSTNDVRDYLSGLQKAGHNPGGVHAHMRTLKALLRWFEREEEPDPPYRNPMNNIRIATVKLDPLQPIDVNDVQKLVRACDNSWLGLRDQAIFYFLFDTGVRISELLALDIDDLDFATGTALIRHGKGYKARTVVFSRQTSRPLRKYLKLRDDDNDALFVSVMRSRLTYEGIRHMIRKRSGRAGIKTPSLHSFRRAFALNCLRNGMDVFSLQLLMGHADLQVLRRYLAQTDDDLRLAHAKASPVDKLF